ncbi:hypothetical protein DL771_005427 [Monosporascus sp. 5C6A]|nr:hypothetical protein DL771_005427 [Monosporascus sp. 5C6A]
MTNFFSLPRELRDQIYELCLLHEEAINPWADYYQRKERTSGLFRASKTVHHEASSLFYTQNRFDFTTTTSEAVASFLGTIGRNADHIRHVIVNFPQFLHLEPGDVTLEDSYVSIIANIQSGCANLSTLTTSLYSTNAMELTLDAIDDPKVVTEALKLVDTQFRTISSLQDIIVELYEDGPNDHIRSEMESYGWTLSTNENMEEEEFDRSWSDGEFEDYGYGYDDDDDYDIDNDSDFWRRAAD